MTLGLRKILNILTVCLAALGILISLFLLFQVWQHRQPVTLELQDGVDHISSTLNLTDDGLVVIDQVVKNVYTSTAYLNEATVAFSQTILSTGQFMDTAGAFVGEDLINTITNTQTALDAAQASAKVIDNILGTLSKVPLIGITYNPSVPLNTALGEVSSSLDPLQSTLKDFQTNLESTRSNMEAFSVQVSQLNKNILGIQQNLEQAQGTISSYREQISLVNDWLDRIKANLPRWTNIAAWLITLVIAWLVIIQISMILQAITQFSNPLVDRDVSKPAK